jgi:Ca2+-binding RTX toxin-like protein
VASRAIVSGGTVTGFSVDVRDEYLFGFGRLALNPQAFAALALLSRHEASARLLAGSDQITGSTANDRLDGFTGNDSIWGNPGDDRVSGGRGNDRLSGGPGNDILTGGRGRDTFVFDYTPGPENVDTVKDFVVKDDSIHLDHEAFKAFDWTFGAGKVLLADQAFRRGVAAEDADDRIIYDPATGVLSYDPDGNGMEAASMLARLPKYLMMTSADFVVF